MKIKPVLRTSRAILALPLAGIILFGCSKNSSVLNPNTSASPTFASISSVVLQPGCVGCHGGAGGYSFDTYANTMHGVTPYDTANSPLYTSVRTGRMPKSGTALSQEQIKAISDWINLGAPNN
jgi:mono/diheme cytochrome c family protein